MICSLSGLLLGQRWLVQFRQAELVFVKPAELRPGYTFFLGADDGIPGTSVLFDLRGVSDPLLK